MTFEDGMVVLVDGPGAPESLDSSLPPIDPSESSSPKRLWAVRSEDVVHAEEECEFGRLRPAGRIKHTNLTGGEPAFAGGELIYLNEQVLVVSGDSGRYGPRSAQELHDVSIAFKDSGYAVYSLGYDAEANRPFPLIGVRPRLI